MFVVTRDSGVVMIPQRFRHAIHAVVGFGAWYCSSVVLAQPSDRWDVEFWGGHFGVQFASNPLDAFPNNDQGVQGGLPRLYGTGQTSPGLNFRFDTSFGDPSPEIDNASADPSENPWLILESHLATAVVSGPAPYPNTNFSGSYTYVFKRIAPYDGRIQVGAAGDYFDDFAEIFVDANPAPIATINRYTASLPAADALDVAVTAGQVLEIRLTNGASLGGFSTNIRFVPNPVAVDVMGSGVEGVASTPVASVLLGDLINGSSASVGGGGNATISQQGSWPAGFSLDTATGAVDIADTVSAGVYTMQYQLCDASAPTRCAVATITIDVTASPPILPSATAPVAVPIGGHILLPAAVLMGLAPLVIGRRRAFNRRFYR